MDAETLRPFLDWYKTNFASIFAKHEGYKWESVQTFQQAYSPVKDDYPSILKESFSKTSNLLNSQYSFSLGMMLDITRLCQSHPELEPSGTDLFFNLFEGISPEDTGEVLLNKISSFRRQIRTFVRTNYPDKHKDFQDLHAVSVYLNHRYPNRFYMYRTSEFTEFNDLIQNEFSFEWGEDRNYLTYLEMCDKINSILRREMVLDEGFRLAVDTAVHSDGKYYPDPEFRILTQDFLYSVTSYYKMDMTGRYAEQMKVKAFTTQVDYVHVEDLSPKVHIAHSSVGVSSTSKTDYVLRQKENSRLGAAGEEWVLAYEKKRLNDAGCKDLAKKVKWVAQKDDSKGYDILSYDDDGNELFIEVKTTNGGVQTPFFISATEMAVSRNTSSKYRLYRVYDFAKAPKLRVIIGDIGLLSPQPTSYIVYTE